VRHNRLTKAIPKAAARKTPVALAVNAELVRFWKRLVLFFFFFVCVFCPLGGVRRYVCCCSFDDDAFARTPACIHSFIHSIQYNSLHFISREQQKAVVVLTGTAGVAGTLTLTQEDPSGATTVVGDITGLEPGKHGLHVHEFGDTTNGCMSTGPHFNPNNMTHGAPTDAIRHAGDLGNVIADAGGCKFTIKDMQIPLTGKNSIVGRAFVIHELEDDLGKGDNSEIGTQGKTSSTTGNAGARLACGVVGLTPS